MTNYKRNFAEDFDDEYSESVQWEAIVPREQFRTKYNRLDSTELDDVRRRRRKPRRKLNESINPLFMEKL